MTMNFVPTDTPAQDVPYFDDVSAEEGWQGKTTSKSIESLKSEVTASIGRLGAMVISFQRGAFVIGDKEREGFQIRYVIDSPGGPPIMGRIDIAALPVRKDTTYRRNSAYKSKCEQSIRMALYMLRVALDGSWLLQKLSPGYAALIPFMIADQQQQRTVSQIWSDGAAMKELMPPVGEEFIEGEIIK